MNEIGAVLRIARFEVPDAAVDEFLDGLRVTHDMLGGLPGCGQNLLLEGQPGDGSTPLLTVVEWADDAAFAAARREAQRAQEAAGFSPIRTIARLGVAADAGVYRVRPWR
ncbi:antibiotic biosynthesis monooxygenase [Pseudonocardia lacus]|uniref:antibiotic biosynthesis monooxygenase n=1 Tax=Pseudonocardia lacus TaxID=2835865 RepID=UPI001BDDA31B|nr:antibiotic biosynthesis monooxygenase [Pseudonocardia lacus]